MLLFLIRGVRVLKSANTGGETRPPARGATHLLQTVPVRTTFRAYFVCSARSMQAKLYTIHQLD